MDVGATVAERFTLKEKIDKGGMGALFRAVDTRTGEDVAVKILRHGALEDRQRFERECTLLASIAHPHIVRYVAHGETPAGALYLVMEWLDGEDLADRLERGPLSIAEATALVASIADVLQEVHGRWIVHRDIKPANLFLVNKDLDRVMLLDFGIARFCNNPRDVTISGATVGTPSYMSPEQVRGDAELDARSDIFSLGCVLFECVTGRPTFRAPHAMAAMLKVLFEVPPLLREVRADAPAALEALTARMLAKDPRRRPRSAAAVLGALLDPPSRSDPGSAAVREQMTRRAKQRVSVIVTGRWSAPADAPPADVATVVASPLETLPSRGVSGPRAIAAQYGARLEQLQDGEAILVLTAETEAATSATDLLARAAGCALAMRRLLPGVPIALATGRVEMGAAMPVGEVIDRAVALLRRATPAQDGAAPAPIRIDEVSAGLLQSRFHVGGDGQSLLLIGEPIGEVESLGRDRTLLGVKTRCFGRDFELKTLAALLDACVTERVARAVVMTGEPGIGKTRVCRELIRQIEEQKAPFSVWVGRGDPVSAGSPLGILGRALRHAFGLSAGEAVELRRTKILARLSGRLAGDEVPRVAAFLGELLEAPFPAEDNVQLRAARLDPMLRGDQMQRAFKDFVAAEAAVHPVVLVLEDFQWADQATARFVDACLRLPDCPLMVLASARPEVSDRFPRLWQERQAHEIRLSGMTPRAAISLVEQVLGHGTPAATVERIVARAGGNAFFLEELIRAVREGKEELPETVLAMLDVRLEALEEEPKHALRAASVFGERFCREGVEALIGGEGSGVGGSLQALEERELIARVPDRSPERVAYVFRHGLVRDAAYGLLTDSNRTIGHRLAGDWLERTGVQDGLLLAEHFEIGEDGARARRWYERAAEQALEANDLEAVVARAAKGLALGAEGEDAGRLHLLAATAHNWRGALQEGADAARAALRLLPHGSDRWYAAIERLAWARGALEDTDGVQALADALRDAGSRAVRPREATVALCTVSSWLATLGRVAAADELAACLDDLPAGDADPVVAANVYALRCSRAKRSQKLAAAVRYAEAACASFERGGDIRNAYLWRANVGHLLCMLGAYERARPLMEATCREAERIGAHYVEAWAKVQLAQMISNQGHLEAAVSLARDAARTAEDSGDRENAARARIVVTRILLATGAHEGALAEARRAVDLAASYAPQHAIALAALSQALLSTARAEEALEAVRGSMKILDTLPSIPALEAFIRLTFAETLKATGDGDAARAALTAARDRVLAQAAEIDEPGLQRSFLEQVPEHARILSLAR